MLRTANAVSAAVVVVGTLGRNRQTDTLFNAEGESWFKGEALATVVPCRATVGDFDTLAVVAAPGIAGVADALATVIMVVGALGGDENAIVYRRAETVG